MHFMFSNYMSILTIAAKRFAMNALIVYLVKSHGYTLSSISGWKSFYIDSSSRSIGVSFLCSS